MFLNRELTFAGHLQTAAAHGQRAGTALFLLGGILHGALAWALVQAAQACTLGTVLYAAEYGGRPITLPANAYPPRYRTLPYPLFTISRHPVRLPDSSSTTPPGRRPFG